MRRILTVFLMFLFSVHSLIAGAGKGPAYLYDYYMLCTCEHEDGSTHLLTDEEIQLIPQIRKDSTDTDEMCKVKSPEDHACPKKLPLKYSACLLYNLSSVIYNRFHFYPSYSLFVQTFNHLHFKAVSGIEKSLFRPPEAFLFT